MAPGVKHAFRTDLDRSIVFSVASCNRHTAKGLVGTGTVAVKKELQVGWVRPLTHSSNSS